MFKLVTGGKEYKVQMPLDKWLYQNKYNPENVEDFAEGCLLDNFLVYLQGGVAAIYENYVNANSSCYRVEFGRYKTGAEKEIVSGWYDRFAI